jgi:hypothetical protein
LSPKKEVRKMTERTVDEFFTQVTGKSPENKNEVVYQSWLESERGWGVRPDGYSLHLSLGDRKRFIDVSSSFPSECRSKFAHESSKEGYLLCW